MTVMRRRMRRAGGDGGCRRGVCCCSASVPAGRYALVSFFLLACVFLVSCGRDVPPSGSAEAAAVERRLADLCGQSLGDSDAPLAIVAVLPVMSGCQDGIGLYVADLAEARPDLFSVRVYDMKSEAGHEVMIRHGIRCAAVLINGTTRFDLGADGGKVLLEGPMDPLDVYDVLSSLVAELSPQPGFTLPEPAACTAPTEAQLREAGFK